MVEAISAELRKQLERDVDLYGNAFLVAGKRVDPRTVQIFRRCTPTEAALHGHIPVPRSDSPRT